MYNPNEDQDSSHPSQYSRSQGGSSNQQEVGPLNVGSLPTNNEATDDFEQARVRALHGKAIVSGN